MNKDVPPAVGKEVEEGEEAEEEERVTGLIKKSLRWIFKRNKLGTRLWQWLSKRARGRARLLALTAEG